MGKKLTFEYIYQYFQNNRCELLEKEYINNSVPLKYICECGNLSQISFSNFQQGQRCSICAKNKKFTFEYVYQYFKENNCELLETEYKNNSILMRYQCKCGKISQIRFHEFKDGQRCKSCAGIEKFTFEYVYQYFKKNSCELLETEYKNNRTLMRYKCSCGNIGKIRFSNFQQGQRCFQCSIKKTSGVNNGNYNPNLTDEDRDLSKTRNDEPEYRIWRKEIFKRDSYTCQKCNQKGYLNSHHIENFSSNKKLRYIISNGTTLCKKCHLQFHKIYGRKNNTQEQLYEFLNTQQLGITNNTNSPPFILSTIVFNSAFSSSL